MHNRGVNTAKGDTRLFSWFYGWNVLAVGIVVVAITVGIIFSSFSFFAVAWIDEFGTSRAEIMMVLAIFQLVAGFLSPFAGRAMDHFQIRWIGIAGILCLSLGLVLASLATAVWHLLVVYAVLMAAANAMAGAMFGPTLAAKWFRGRRGLALGLATLGTSLGSLVFPLLVAYLVPAIDWRATMLILAGSTAVLAIPALWLVVRDSPEQKGVEPDPEVAGRAPRPDSDNHWTTIKILKQPVFWCIIAGFAPLMVASAGLVSNIGPLAQDLEISSHGAGFLVSIWSLTVILGKIGFGVLADRVGMGWLYVVSCVPTLIGLAIIQMEPGYLAMVIVMIVFGIGSGGNYPLIGVVISRHFGPLAFGSVMGLFTLCSRPTAFSAPLAGWVRDYTGSYDLFWLGVLILASVLAPCMIYVSRTSKVS